jgi:hypothetical protein
MNLYFICERRPSRSLVKSYKSNNKYLKIIYDPLGLLQESRKQPQSQSVVACHLSKARLGLPGRKPGSTRQESLSVVACRLSKAQSRPAVACRLSKAQSRPAVACRLSKAQSRPAVACRLSKAQSRPAVACHLSKASLGLPGRKPGSTRQEAWVYQAGKIIFLRPGNVPVDL